MREDKSPRSSRSRSRSNSNTSKENGKKKSRSLSSKSRSSKSRSRSRSNSSERDEYRLHIADIADDVRKSDLEKLFTQYGSLKELWMTHSSPVFGFAVYKTKESAAAALKATDGASVGGSRIRVTHARPRTRGQGRRSFHPNMRCYQCGYSGHFYRDCPDLDGGKSYGGSRRRTGGRRERDYDRDYGRDYGRRRHSSRRYDDYDYDRRRSGGGGGGRRHRY